MGSTSKLGTSTLMLIMEIRMKKRLIIEVFIILSLVGCVSTSPKNDSAVSSQSGSKSDSEDTSRAKKNISLSIGREVGDFKIVSKEEGNGSASLNSTIYTVKTNDGETYKCNIEEPSGFAKIMSFGMSGGQASAMCTDFTKGSKKGGKKHIGSCNDLLRAAGKC